MSLSNTNQELHCYSRIRDISSTTPCNKQWANVHQHYKQANRKSSIVDKTMRRCHMTGYPYFSLFISFYNLWGKTVIFTIKNEPFHQTHYNYKIQIPQRWAIFSSLRSFFVIFFSLAFDSSSFSSLFLIRTKWCIRTRKKRRTASFIRWDWCSAHTVSRG